MSNKALTWALEQQTGSPTRKLVLLKLADQANDDGYCWPSKETIARHCEIHRKTVQRLIGELADAGFLSVRSRRDGAVNLTNVYQLEMGVGAQDSQGEHTEPPWDHSTPRGGSTRRPGVGAQDSPEPSGEPSKEPSVNPQSAHGRANGKQAQHFDDFWARYPRKRGKKKCREVWARKRLDQRADEIIHDVTERQRRDRQWIDGYIPNPSTYLNQERWEDEFEAPKGKEKSDGIDEWLENKRKEGRTLDEQSPI